MQKIRPAEQAHRQLKSSRSNALYSLNYSLSEFLGFEQLMVYHELLMPQKCSSAKHSHSHKREAIYLLSGSLELCCNNIQEKLHAGEIIIFEPGEEHQLSNTGSESAEYLIFSEISTQDRVHFSA